MSFLAKDSTYPYPWSITCYLEDFGEVRKGKDRGLGHNFLELMKYFGSSFSLGEIPFLKAIRDGGSDGTEASYEPSIEGNKSMEASDFLKIFGFGPLQNGLDFLWVHGDSFRLDNIA